MTVQSAAATVATTYRRGPTWKRLPIVPTGILATFVLAAFFAPIIAPHDPTGIDILARARPPGSPDHILGTDLLGRDVLSRLIWGARTSFLIGVFALGCSAIIGMAAGLIAGYYGGRIDWAVMRVVDVGLCFPTVLLALIIAIYLGVGLWTLVIAVVATMWAQFARMTRGEVLTVRNMDYVTLARIAGVSSPKLILRHIAPNILTTMLVTASLLMAHVILMEAALSFLGLGLPPGAPAWGVMVAEGRDSIGRVWWLSVLPGVAITIVVMGLNLFADWLSDELDPRVRTLVD